MGNAPPLTERGRTQAEALGKRLLSERIECVISSDMTRAQETADIVGGIIGLPVWQSLPLFSERRNPSVMLGKHASDSDVEAIWREIGRHYDERDWHHSDEENFHDLRVRGRRALHHLLTLPHERIVTVSHGLFMKIILADVLLGDHLTGRIFWDQFIPVKNAQNTGIMKLEHRMSYAKTGWYWKLHTWNDHAHLSGDLAEDARFMA